MGSGNAFVLVVDDDDLVTSQISWLLEENGFAFECVGTVAAAMRRLDEATVGAVVLDLYLPDGTGMAVLERALALEPPPPVLMMTARAEIRSAVDAMRQGASDFIEKPIDLEDLRARLERVIDIASVRRRLEAYEEKDRSLAAPISNSKSFRAALAMADRVAATPSTSALLLGESGAGKEVLATRIHAAGHRRFAPFVRVNLAAIPDAMLEAELFGSVRGAYTDSKRDRAGLFASADGGTLLLDEIGEMKIELQAKLLRALEGRSFFPVGADRERALTARILAATNRDPAEQIARGLLREDLYYRLATVTIRVPPLRERTEDILPLTEHFAALLARELGKTPRALTEGARRAIVQYDWPGNVRQLKNAIERALILSDGPIDEAALGLVHAEPAAEDGAGPPLRLRDVEAAHIERVLALAGGSKTKAAELLGVSRSTLFEKLKRG